jgi:hypothetical protein
MAHEHILINNSLSVNTNLDEDNKLSQSSSTGCSGLCSRYASWLQLSNYNLNNFLGSTFLDAYHLFLLRCFITLWFSIALICIWIYEAGVDYPVFLTNQSYCMILAYFISQVIVGYRNRDLFNEYRRIKLEQPLINPNSAFDRALPSHWYFIPIILFDLLSALVVIVTIVYWALLAPTSKGNPIYFLNFQVHAFNTIIYWTDLALNHMKLNYRHITIVYLFGLYYIIFAWIYHAASKVWIYAFLDFYKLGNLLVYAAILLSPPLFYSLHKFILQKKLAHAESKYQNSNEEEIYLNNAQYSRFGDNAPMHVDNTDL